MTCYNCGSHFISIYDGMVTCHMCGRVLYMELKPIKQPYIPKKTKRNLRTIILTCSVCGKQFKALDKGGRWAKGTCSAKCKAERVKINGANYKKRQREHILGVQ